ncbi:MAG TPA: hypothetical protein VFN85_09130 [Solirubrobacterales bacterium]|nr:hypothetical protein [Solirubrobacterales bacterium]
MAENRFLRGLKANMDAVDVVFVLFGSVGYAAFVSWANVIVRAIRGEEVKESWRTVASSGVLVGVWALMSGARVREMAALRGAAVEMRGLVHDAAAQSEVRDRRAAERDDSASQQQERMLLLTRWLVALAGLTLAAAIVTLVVALAQ